MNLGPLNVAVVGANGRVGKLLIAEIEAADDLRLSGALDQGDTQLPAGTDVAIEFSLPPGTRHWVPAARSARVPYVLGTTGLSDDDERMLDEASSDIPLLQATNMSLGVALLNRLAADAARVMGVEADCEIVESHHRRKLDAPSGTAVTLHDRILAARGQSRDDLRHGRHGNEARKPGSVGVHSLRLGGVVGVHEAHFASDGEIVTVKHEATDRRTFAIGALRAARWIVDQRPGRYTMDDVLAGALGT